MKRASKEQLLQIALYGDCSMDLKYKACRQLKINEQRNRYNPKLSKYWQTVFYRQFKEWS